MSNFSRNWIALALVAAPMAGLTVNSASAQSAVNCFAQITSPLQGSGVALTGPVEGRSATYGNVSVWILTHRKGLGEWWPQNGGPVQGGATDWTAKVTYGTEKEAGQPFEIAAVPVDQRTGEGLAGWTVRASVYSEYGGIPLPKPAKGCRYNIVELRRN